jgi:ribosomal protein S18 acetylase RimI-like enzyme
LTIDEEDWAQSHVAIVDGRIVGMVLTRNQWIDDLWVLRESRGQGIGRELLDKGESEIAARGYRTFRLRVVKSNRAAVDFYRKNGWQAAREFPHEKLSVAMLEMTKSDFPETSSGAPPQRQGRS